MSINTLSEHNTTSSSSASGGLGGRFSPLGIWSFSIGTAIGWGSLVVTCSAYLSQGGVLGTGLGLLLGMLVILIITRNLMHMICRNQSAGGIYTYACNICGRDYGFLAAWFLLLTYLSILWANITSVPLFARYFLGDVFRFGFSYTIFGFEVHFGETLLCILTISLIGLLCSGCRKAPQTIMIVSALTFVAGFTLCALTALAHHGQSGFSYSPLFLSESSSIAQISRIAVISPWAFIGFENISHFSEEYSFKVRKVRRILLVSVIMTTVLYLFVTLLSVTAYPPEYATWLDYIRDMGNLSGFKAVPAFYAIHYYMGDVGVLILMLALLGAILTSLIGNTLALSRLLYAGARDGSAPAPLAELNEHGDPAKAIWAVVIVSLFIPFLGRTAIGWIVDVTTLGATIIYGLVSYAVWQDARQLSLRKERISGMTGLVLMIAFALMLLLPNLLSFKAMESESYILFVFWAILGLVYFRTLVNRHQERQYGHSVLVWMVLLLLVLFASMMWVTRQTETVTRSAIDEIRQFYEASPDTVTESAAFLKSQSSRILDTNALYTIASFVMFIVSTGIILSNYQIMRRRDADHTLQLNTYEKKVVTDPLTGVKNRHAYSLKEKDLNERIGSGESGAFAVAVCDINNLKQVNDREGHSAGDQCIRACCRLICNIFSHSPVYRIGGDEFAVVMENDDYEHREELIAELNRRNADLEKTAGTAVAIGMSEFRPGEDESVLAVFARADGNMYRRKNEMKISRG